MKLSGERHVQAALDQAAALAQMYRTALETGLRSPGTSWRQHRVQGELHTLPVYPQRGELLDYLAFSVLLDDEPAKERVLHGALALLEELSEQYDQEFFALPPEGLQNMELSDPPVPLDTIEAWTGEFEASGWLQRKKGRAALYSVGPALEGAMDTAREQAEREIRPSSFLPADPTMRQLVQQEFCEVLDWRGALFIVYTAKAVERLQQKNPVPPAWMLPSVRY